MFVVYHLSSRAFNSATRYRLRFWLRATDCLKNRYSMDENSDQFFIDSIDFCSNYLSRKSVSESESKETFGLLSEKQFSRPRLCARIWRQIWFMKERNRCETKWCEVRSKCYSILFVLFSAQKSEYYFQLKLYSDLNHFRIHFSLSLWVSNKQTKKSVQRNDWKVFERFLKFLRVKSFFLFVCFESLSYIIFRRLMRNSTVLWPYLSQTLLAMTFVGAIDQRCAPILVSICVGVDFEAQNFKKRLSECERWLCLWTSHSFTAHPFSPLSSETKKWLTIANKEENSERNAMKLE